MLIGCCLGGTWVQSIEVNGTHFSQVRCDCDKQLQLIRMRDILAGDEETDSTRDKRNYWAIDYRLLFVSLLSTAEETWHVNTDADDDQS